MSPVLFLVHSVSQWNNFPVLTCWLEEQGQGFHGNAGNPISLWGSGDCTHCSPKEKEKRGSDQEKESWPRLVLWCTSVRRYTNVRYRASLSKEKLKEKALVTWHARWNVSWIRWTSVMCHSRKELIESVWGGRTFCLSHSRGASRSFYLKFNQL